MTSQSSLKKAFLNSPIIFDAINQYSNYLATFLDKSNIGLEYMNYVMEKYPNDIDHIRFLSKSDQISFFKNEINYQNFIEKEEAKNILSDLKCKTIEYLLITPYFSSIFLNYNIYTIKQILDIGVTLPNYLQEDKRLINKLLEIEDVTVYHITFINISTILY